NIQPEIDALPGDGRTYTEIFPISNWFSEPFFVEKWVVYMQG
ncbi:MAG: 16S rRNA (guanine(527)-N(7))-methyltransferase RsmG, partial [Thermoanaerobaculia bacterium]|nr:16S rRNA (guanine(527)-N(7))-methyltransferase RsmG [Thermoanaerobaculia bacterium]